MRKLVMSLALLIAVSANAQGNPAEAKEKATEWLASKVTSCLMPEEVVQAYKNIDSIQEWHSPFCVVVRTEASKYILKDLLREK